MPILKTTAVLMFAVATALSQDAPATDADSRAGQIEAARKAKQASIEPAPTAASDTQRDSILSKAFKIWNASQSGSHGLSLRLGGLAHGSGFALGPDETVKLGDVYDPWLIWDSYAVGSLQGYYRAQSGVELPRLLGDHAFLSLSGGRFDYPRLPYYGEGPESRKTGRTDYRMQDDQVVLNGGFRIFHSVRAGLEGSFQNIDIRTGTDSGIAHTADVYPALGSEARARGAEFLSGGFFLQYDGRDAPLNSHSGTYLSAEFQNIDGSPSALGQFNRYDFEAQQYLHFWNKRRVIAARVKSTLTTPHQGSIVPFYLEPTLGGPDDLRGFRPYRFYDRNAVFANAEYRWTVTEALDMALFADAGKVYHDATSFSLAHVQTDIGVGLRAKVGDAVPFRLDVGCSREGVHVWLTFYNVF